MSEFWLTVAWVGAVFLFLLSGFFSSAETAIMSVSRLRLRDLVDKGDRRAKSVDDLLAAPGQLLSGILLGNNFANVMLASLATALSVPLWGDMAVLYVSPVLTILLLIFAEILPKTLATRRSMWMARMTVIPLAVFIRIASPVIWITSRFANLLLSPFVPVNKDEAADAINLDDLSTMAKVGHEQGSFGPVTHDILHGLREFTGSKVLDVMVPRHEIVSMSVSDGWEGFRKVVEHDGHTRIPVWRDNAEDIIGVLHAKDILLRPGNEEPPEDLTEVLRPALFVPESIGLGPVLRRMQESKSEMVFVVDEYGGLEGLVTMKDLIEELIGDIEDEHDKTRNRRVDAIRPGTIIADATVTLRYLKRNGDLDLTSHGARTIGGMLVGAAPGELKPGTTMKLDGRNYTVLSMSGRFLKKVRIDWDPEQEKLRETEPED